MINIHTYLIKVRVSHVLISCVHVCVYYGLTVLHSHYLDCMLHKMCVGSCIASLSSCVWLRNLLVGCYMYESVCVYGDVQCV